MIQEIEDVINANIKNILQDTSLATSRADFMLKPVFNDHKKNGHLV